MRRVARWSPDLDVHAELVSPAAEDFHHAGPKGAWIREVCPAQVQHLVSCRLEPAVPLVVPGLPIRTVVNLAVVLDDQLEEGKEEVDATAAHDRLPGGPRCDAVEDIPDLAFLLALRHEIEVVEHAAQASRSEVMRQFIDQATETIGRGPSTEASPRRCGVAGR